MFKIVILYKLQQANKDRLHHASFGAGGNQNHFFLVKQIKMIIIKKGKQFTFANWNNKIKQCKNGKWSWSFKFFSIIKLNFGEKTTWMKQVKSKFCS